MRSYFKECNTQLRSTDPRFFRFPHTNDRVTITASKMMAKRRQKVLVLYLANSALDSAVKGWSIYDGTRDEMYTTGDSDSPPYPTGLDALKDGWRVIQFPQLIPPYPDMEYTTSFQMYEFIFEKLEESDG